MAPSRGDLFGIVGNLPIGVIIYNIIGYRSFPVEGERVRKEYVKETVAHHAYLMIGELETPNMGEF